MATGGQFSLLRERRFGPLFLAQWLGAFNDNVFRNALVILITYRLAAPLPSEVLVNVATVSFILPFFLISATAGQIADKYEKSALIRRIKLLEIGIMVLAAVGFMTGNVVWLIAVLFLTGTQSALFGPLKYSILPQHLRDEELIGGNALVATSTFLAILVGAMLGGMLIGLGEIGRWAVSIAVVLLAIGGYTASRRIPMAPPVAAGLVIDWNPLRQTWRIFAFTRKNRTVFLSILGISWFWFVGAILLTQLPSYAQTSLGGSEQVVTLLLALFSLGVGAGSLLCERLSGRTVELGLVPLGAIGLTVFLSLLYFARPISSDVLELADALAFLGDPANWSIVSLVVLTGVFGGFYVVPLYALVQQRSQADRRSRVIACNNILNALFIVLSSLTAVMLLSAGLSIPQLLLVVAAMNAVVAIYIFALVPEFLMRFIIWILVHILYRVRTEGLANVPDEGPALLVCNHVSFMDALIIGGCCRRPVRFVMDHGIFRVPILNFVFRTAKAIPVASRKVDPELLDRALDRIAEELETGNLVCIFPEGKITSDGEMNPFRPGVESIIERTPVTVIPMALRGLWGSFFSRQGGRAMFKVPKRFWSKIGLVAGPAVMPTDATAARLEQRVRALRGEFR